MYRWQRVGMNEKALLRIVANAHEFMPYVGDYERAPDLRAAYSSDIEHYAMVILLYHLEAPHLPGTNGSSFSEKCVEACVNYFWGDWRQAYEANVGDIWNEAKCRQKADWYHQYRDGLLCALILDDEKSLPEILRWPDDDLPYDGGAWYVPREENTFQILLALRERNEKPTMQKRLRESISAGRPLRPKLLLEGLDAIESNDAGRFGLALEKLLAHHLKKEFRPDNTHLAYLQDGSILYHIARRRGLQLPPLSEALRDRLVTRETIGCSGMSW